jgi:hypothetical protein
VAYVVMMCVWGMSDYKSDAADIQSSGEGPSLKRELDFYCMKFSLW